MTEALNTTDTNETTATAVAESDGPESNEMPKVAADKLPTIPTELPKIVLEYAGTSSRGKIQVRHASKYLETLEEFGGILLSQHHAEGAAELRLESEEEFADKRAELEELDSQIEKYLAAVAKLQKDFDDAKSAAIAEIVAENSGDVDYEEAEAEYSIAYTAMTAPSAVKNWEAAGEQVHSAFKEFVKSLPTATNLVEGKRKGVRNNSTMPGSASSGEGWKPSFAWLEVSKPGEETFSRVDGVTTIGQLAKALDGGKSYDRILAGLKSATNGVASVNDDQTYEWQTVVQDLDNNGTEVITRYRGMALSRATKNARANAAPAKPDETPAPESVNPPADNSQNDAGDAAVDF